MFAIGGVVIIKPNNEQILRKKSTLLCAVPVALCLMSSLLYDNNNPDSGLTVLGIGLILTLFACPLYYAILCWHSTIKKSLQFSSCVTICLLMNTLTNITLILVLGLITGMWGTMILWMLTPFAISMAVNGICLLCVMLIKRTHDNKKQ